MIHAHFRERVTRRRAFFRPRVGKGGGGGDASWFSRFPRGGFTRTRAEKRATRLETCDEIHPHDRSSFLKSLSLKPHVSIVKKVKKNNTLTYANARKEKRILQNYGMFNPISLFLVIQFNQPASYNLLSVIRFPRGEFPPLGTGSSALVA